MQKILILATRRGFLRDAVLFTRIEDPEVVDFTLPEKSWTSCYSAKKYQCPLEAMADGWELMGMPVKDGWIGDDGFNSCFFAWWMVKESPTTAEVIHKLFEESLPKKGNAIKPNRGT